MPKPLAALAAALLSIPLAACGTAPPPGPPPVSRFAASQAPVPEYRIQIGDALGIKFFLNPELNEEIVVRPDGRISLQLIPEIVVAGLTPSELGRRLEELYGSELQEPQIAVIVRAFAAQRVYVDGEVTKPAELELRGPLTVLQAVASVGGFTERARLDEVFLIRRGEDGRPEVIPLDIKELRSSEDPRLDPVLEPFDIVYVPKSAIANVNQWVDQYVRRNIPMSLSLGYRF